MASFFPSPGDVTNYITEYLPFSRDSATGDCIQPIWISPNAY